MRRLHLRGSVFQPRRKIAGVHSRGQALIEYVLLFALLSVFGQWIVRYFSQVLSEGATQLGINLTIILSTGMGWQ
jgi:hypothetical protein